MSKPKIDKNTDLPDHMIRQLLTPSEIRMLKNRWQILNLLEDGQTIRGIAETVKVGTDTVVRVSKMKVGGSVKKTSKSKDKGKLPFKTRTPWIFGKNE